MSLQTKTALFDFLTAQIETAILGDALFQVSLISKYTPLDLKGQSKFLKISLADFMETEGRTDELKEHDVLFYLEAFVRPVSVNLSDEEAAVDEAVDIMRGVRRSLILDQTELNGNICNMFVERFKVSAGMSKLGATRFGVAITNIIINPMKHYGE